MVAIVGIEYQIHPRPISALGGPPRGGGPAVELASFFLSPLCLRGIETEADRPRIAD